MARLVYARKLWYPPFAYPAALCEPDPDTSNGPRLEPTGSPAKAPLHLLENASTPMPPHSRALDPSTPILLTREAFARLVLARSNGRCVLCGDPAVDAHHVLDRKLYPDGGYYLGNGAAVCAPCHLACEHTRVSVQDVRQAAGITHPVLPPTLEPGVDYDKWGNRLLEHGLRHAGPLAGDTGMRRALAAGGVLGTLVLSTP